MLVNLGIVLWMKQLSEEFLHSVEDRCLTINPGSWELRRISDSAGNGEMAPPHLGLGLGASVAQLRLTKSLWGGYKRWIPARDSVLASVAEEPREYGHAFMLVSRLTNRSPRWRWPARGSMGQVMTYPHGVMRDDGLKSLTTTSALGLRRQLMRWRCPLGRF